jgi:hypothetical protein
MSPLSSHMPAPIAALVATVALCSVLLASTQCATHAPPSTTPILSPTAQNLLVTSLGALQVAAIALGPVDGISSADTTTVINTISAAIATIQAGQTGWLSATDVLLAKIPTLVSASTADTLSPYLNAISAVILDLYAQGGA